MRGYRDPKGKMAVLPSRRSSRLAVRAHLTSVVAVTLLMAVVAGCDSGSEPHEAQRSALAESMSTRVRSRATISAPGPARPTIESPGPPNGGRTYFTPVATAASVAEVLADGVITREEFDAATARMIQCLDESGVTHSEPVYDEGDFQYKFAIEAKAGSQPGLTVYDECWMEYAQDITGRWVMQNQRH